MNASFAYASESILGPPSDPVHVQEFIDRCSTSQAICGNDGPSPLDTAWSGLSERNRQDVEDECSVGDLEHTLNKTLSNPVHYVHIARTLENNIELIRATSKPTGQLKSKSRKRKIAETTIPDDSELSAESLQFRTDLDNITLRCWPYPVDAANFIRPQKNPDLNILTNAKKSLSAGLSSTSARKADAIIIVSVYNPSQTIGDLYDVIPCPSNEVPLERVEDGEIVGFEADQVSPHRGCVVCIEGVAYGDGQSEEDYSDKLIKHLELIPEKKRVQLSKGMCMHDQPLADITLRLNQPYWVLHQGTCEHFLIVDHIRMLQPSDPQDGYPLTLYIVPPIVDLCMACTRVPAKFSVVGDVRLGQSPFKICGPCWKIFGEPRPEDGVLVVPLPKYEHGW